MSLAAQSRVWEACFVLLYTSFAVNSNTGGIFPVTWLHIFLEGDSYQLNSPGSWTQTQPGKATSSSERKSSVILGELVAEHDLCLQLSTVLEIPCPCPCPLKLLFFFFVLSLANLFMLSFWQTESMDVTFRLLHLWDFNHIWLVGTWTWQNFIEPELIQLKPAVVLRQDCQNDLWSFKGIRRPRPSCRNLEAPIFCQRLRGFWYVISNRILGLPETLMYIFSSFFLTFLFVVVVHKLMTVPFRALILNRVRDFSNHKNTSARESVCLLVTFTICHGLLRSLMSLLISEV